MIQLLEVPPSAADPLTGIARELMSEYAAMPHTVGRWTTVAHDLAQLPMPYVPPSGVLLVAMDDGTAVGCGALRLLADPGVAEIKRVYVRSIARRSGVGERIMCALMRHATDIGCRAVRLDTAPELTAARALYARLGFVPIPAYGAAVHQDSICFEWTATDRNTPLL